jgi:hypothetical protein
MALAPPLLCLFFFFVRGEGAVVSPLTPTVRYSLHRTRYCESVLLLTPVQTHKLPLWQVPLDAVIGGVALGTKALDEGLGLFNVRKADELAPQSETPLLGMNAAASLSGAVDGVAPVALVEQRVDSVFVAGDWVAVV